jgi:pimeloyl-ACP methyl ester carboxylesterase
LVDAAGCYREFGSLRPLAELLAADFTVVTYDRRGREGSTDTLPYAVEREVDDLAALITKAGGSASVYAVSSGALLALHAAASGLPIPKLALFEPPIGADENQSAGSDFTAELAELVAAGRRADAVERFQRSIGVPPEVIARMAPKPRSALEAVAHTLVYDCMISDAMSLELLTSVTAPVRVIDSEGSTGDLTGWVAAVSPLTEGSFGPAQVLGQLRCGHQRVVGADGCEWHVTSSSLAHRFRCARERDCQAHWT